MIKNIRREMQPSLASSMNAMMRLDHYPTMWKESKVLMIKKLRDYAKIPQTYKPFNNQQIITRDDYSSQIAGKDYEKRVTSTRTLQVQEQTLCNFYKVAAERIIRKKITEMILLM